MKTEEDAKRMPAPDRTGEPRRARTLLFLHGVLLLYSIGGIHAKLAATSPLLSTGFLVNCAMLILISSIYAYVWQQLLKVMPLNTAYASKSVTIIWGFLWGRLLFAEHITLPMAAGALLVAAGLLLIVSADGGSPASLGPTDGNPASHRPTGSKPAGTKVERP